MKEGVIKFQVHRIHACLNPGSALSQLIIYRNRIRKINLIGVDHSGLGFGNISVRSPKGFMISGSQTGAIKKASSRHFAEVFKWDFEANKLWCSGLLDASSESLTHAMLYELSDQIGAVLHIHHQKLWRKTLNQWPTTTSDIDYGSVSMAEAIRKLWNQNAFSNIKAIAMGGHQNGLIAFGKDLEEVCDFLIGQVQDKNL